MAEITISLKAEIDGLEAKVAELEGQRVELGTLPLSQRVVDPLYSLITAKHNTLTAMQQGLAELYSRLPLLETAIATPGGI